jgi:hypothetical protein
MSKKLYISPFLHRILIATWIVISLLNSFTGYSAVYFYRRGEFEVSGGMAAAFVAGIALSFLMAYMLDHHFTSRRRLAAWRPAVRV